MGQAVQVVQVVVVEQVVQVEHLVRVDKMVTLVVLLFNILSLPQQQIVIQVMVLYD